MRIAIGSDHRGCQVKDIVIGAVAGAGHSYQDFGCYTSDEAVDYPDYAVKVADAVARGDFDRGILICYTGIGMCIAANKVKGIRAALCHSASSARYARQHNDANVCCLAAEGDKARFPAIIEAFLATDFEGGRHQRRVDKIKAIEDRYC